MCKNRLSLIIFTTILISSLISAPDVFSAPVLQDNSIRYTFSRIAEKVIPSVVTVRVEQTVKGQRPGDFPDSDFFRFFGPPRGQDSLFFKLRGLGSGVIVSSDGYILTNSHVIGNADKIMVSMPGRKQPIKATVVGSDRLTDLAVIKVDADNLPTAQLGNSDSLRIGEWVLAIGAPFQLEHSVTAGIISAVGRSRVRIAEYEDFIQTDAAINPGNSGGALVNFDGAVIGINTAIASQTSTYNGVGFAIPINMAKKIMTQLITEGRVVRGWLGVAIQDLDPEIKEARKISVDQGILISEVRKDSPAEKAGFKVGDVIIEYQDKKYSTTDSLRMAIADTRPGSRVTFKVLRIGTSRTDSDAENTEQTMTLTATLVQRPDTPPMAVSQSGSEDRTTAKLGLTVKPITPVLAEEMELSENEGVVVLAVTAGSPAAEAGLTYSDVILQINRQQIQSLEDYQTVIRNLKPGDAVAFLVKRKDGTRFLSTRLPE